MDEVGDYIIDDEHAIKPLSELGWQVSTVSWRQTIRSWRDFDIVIIRSTWDYCNDVPNFLMTLERIDQETLLANRLDLIRWNLVKTYMRDLQKSGIGIVPTLWTTSPEADFFDDFSRKLNVDDIVIKPVVGASGEDAYRVTKSCSLGNLANIRARFRGRDCMIQPFMPNIVSEGEYSLFFFGGQYSHAILKSPTESEFRSQEEHGAQIRSVQPQDKLLLRAHQVIETLSLLPLYARVDFIRDAQGDFLVMELELIEPSLYLRADLQAPVRFAAAIEGWYKTAKGD